MISAISQFIMVPVVIMLMKGLFPPVLMLSIIGLILYFVGEITINSYGKAYGSRKISLDQIIIPIFYMITVIISIYNIS